MKTIQNRRPAPNAYGPYYQKYIDKVSDGDIVKTLTMAKTTVADFFENLPQDKWTHRYAPGKWSIKEVLQHMIDGERVFAYRALRIGRNDRTPLPGFDENRFAENCHADNRSPASLIAEYSAVRESTVQLFASLNEEDMDRIGTASDSPASPFAIAYIIAGHELHHIEIIKDRYL